MSASISICPVSDMPDVAETIPNPFARPILVTVNHERGAATFIAGIWTVTHHHLHARNVGRAIVRMLSEIAEDADADPRMIARERGCSLSVARLVIAHAQDCADKLEMLEQDGALDAF